MSALETTLTLQTTDGGTHFSILCVAWQYNYQSIKLCYALLTLYMSKQIIKKFLTLKWHHQAGQKYQNEYFQRVFESFNKHVTKNHIQI